MNFDDGLRRYIKGLFKDRDVTRCTGLSVRAWRELIKVGAVRTVTENRGPGRVRLCDATTFKRAAVIAAINRAGFNLAMSGRIAYFLPLDELLYAIWDPCTILFANSADVDPNTGLPPRRAQPKANWFDPNTPAQTDPDHDWLIEIYDGRFVGALYGDEHKPLIYGDLRNNGTTFISWYPAHRQFQFSDKTESANNLAPGDIGSLRAKWQDPMTWADRLKPSFLDYKYEDHDADDDPLALIAEATIRSPTFKTIINVTLAIRKALRRYLGIEAAVPFARGRKRS
jgi:hypothetical protein